MNRSVPDFAKGYWNPYVAGIALGLVLLATFYTVGMGLGASGAFSRTAAVTAHVVAPQAIENNAYFGKYYEKGDRFPLMDWLVFEVLGVLIGGLVAAVTAGRLKREVLKGPQVSSGTRIVLALVGGIVAGVGTRFAMGCTSGQALSGGATLAVGSWVFMMAVFAAAFVWGIVVRREWI